MADPTARGRFVWHELVTPSGPAAHAFYTETLGWKTQGWEHEPSYSMFVAPTGPLGASVEKPTDAPHWVAYIGTLDVSATVDAAVRLGARLITPPTVIPNAGTHAVLADPQGAIFGLHASATAPRPEAAPERGEFSWHELATTTASKDAFAFYTTLFGWDEITQFDMGPSGTYLIFGRNGRQLGGMFNKGATGKPGPAYWLGYVRVKNLDETVAKVKAARGTVLAGPMDVPDGDRIVQLMDPQGALFAAHRVAADAQPAPAAKPAAAKPVKAPARKAAKPAARAPKKKRRVAKPAKRKAAAKKKPAKKKARKKTAAKKAAPRRRAKKKRAVAKRPARSGKRKPKRRR